jgi:hypothetical protein
VDARTIVAVGTIAECRHSTCNQQRRDSPNLGAVDNDHDRTRRFNLLEGHAPAGQQSSSPTPKRRFYCLEESIEERWGYQLHPCNRHAWRPLAIP